MDTNKAQIQLKGKPYTVNLDKLKVAYGFASESSSLTTNKKTKQSHEVDQSKTQLIKTKVDTEDNPIKKPDNINHKLPCYDRGRGTTIEFF